MRLRERKKPFSEKEESGKARGPWNPARELPNISRNMVSSLRFVIVDFVHFEVSHGLLPVIFVRSRALIRNLSCCSTQLLPSRIQ